MKQKSKANRKCPKFLKKTNLMTIKMTMNLPNYSDKAQTSKNAKPDN